MRRKFFNPQSNKNMNAKQTIPVIARVAPPLLFVVLVGLAIKSLFSNEEKKLETVLVSEIPKNVPVVPPVSIPATPKISAPVPIPVVPISEDLPQSSPSQKWRIVLREDLAQIFQHGARSLYRIDAVTKLQNLGFCKTAAYEALSPDGRFASWLQIAPDGIITWATHANRKQTPEKRGIRDGKSMV
jgi:hypothetical protein